MKLLTLKLLAALPSTMKLPGAPVLPGFGELMRQVSQKSVPTAILSRQTAGVRGKTLIINLTFEWLELECRTLFKNQEGLTLESSPWKPVRLDPAARAIYAAPSLKKDATRFLIQIRRAQPATRNAPP